MPYVYKMVDIPSTIDGKRLERCGAEKVIEQVVNHHAQKGWEYVGIESMEFQVPPGCLYFWRSPEVHYSRFIVFRGIEAD